MIIPVDSDRRLAGWCAVWSTLRPDRARTVDEVRYEESLDCATSYWIAVDVAGRPAIAARLYDSRWTDTADAPELEVAAAPSHLGRLDAVIDRAADAARQWTKDAVRVACRDCRADRGLRDMLRRRGFELVETDTEAVLPIDHVRTWDPVPPNGVRVTSLQDEPGLRASAHRCFEMSDADEPGVGETARRPFEEWAREFQSPWATWGDCLVAASDDEVVGWASLERFAGTPGVAWNGFTGTHPAHRGKGIASVLKHRIVDLARRHGIHELRTENEQTNLAMRRINEKLGYVPYVDNERWQLPL